MTQNFALSFERDTPLTPRQIWQGWTDPAVLKKWFTPAPWMTVDVRVDLRPGGEFYTKMKGPEAGEEFSGSSCYLEVIPEKKLVWSSALLPGYQPKTANDGEFLFTAIIEITPKGTGSIYKVTALHSDEAGMNTHRDMGFETGWNAAFSQLENYYS